MGDLQQATEAVLIGGELSREVLGIRCPWADCLPLTDQQVSPAGALILPAPVPFVVRSTPSLSTSAMIATRTAISAMTPSTGSGWRSRNGSRRRVDGGSVRRTAVASPVDLPERASEATREATTHVLSDEAGE